MKQQIWRMCLVGVALVLVLTGCGLFPGDEQTEGSTPVPLAPETNPPADTGSDGAGSVPAPPVAAEPTPAADAEAGGGSPAEPAPAAETAPPAAAPVALPAVTFIEPPVGTGGAPGTAVTHRVSTGEWLMQIARCYGTDYGALRRANPGIYNPNWILPDAVVTVPNPGSLGPVTGAPCVEPYVVQAGDTWETLAAARQSTAVILQRANPGWLYAGRTIWVPALSGTTTLAPPRSHDLIFILNGDLAVWPHSDNRVMVYPDPTTTILELATNDDGNPVLVRQTRDGNATTEIALIDRAANSLTVLEAGLPPDLRDINAHERSQLLLAPDGQKGAYTALYPAGYVLTTFDQNQIRASLAYGTHGGNDFFTPQLFPGKDADTFLLLDGGGIYEYAYDLDTGENHLVTIGPDPLSDGVGVFGYTARAWSPAGQYLLTEVGYYEGGGYFIIDSASGQGAHVPNGDGYVTRSAAAWRSDGAVVVMAPHDGLQPGNPTFFVYDVASPGGSLTLTETARSPLGFGGPVANVFSFTMPDVQTAPAELITAVLAENVRQVFALPAGDVFTLVPRAPLPGDAYRQVWAPDSSGALFEIYGEAGSAGDLVYVGTSGYPPFSLRAWLGSDMKEFHWVVP